MAELRGAEERRERAGGEAGPRVHEALHLGHLIAPRRSPLCQRLSRKENAGLGENSVLLRKSDLSQLVASAHSGQINRKRCSVTFLGMRSREISSW